MSRLLVRSHEHPGRLSARQVLPLLAVLAFMYSLTTFPVAHASQFESCCGCGGGTVPWRLDISYTLDGPDCPSPGSYTYRFEYQDQCLWTSDGGATNNTGVGGEPLPDGTVIHWSDTCDYQTPVVVASNPLCQVTGASVGGREYATCGEGATCGNGIIEGAEECDDGNTASGDGCSSVCAYESVCGSPITVSGSCPGGCTEAVPGEPPITFYADGASSNGTIQVTAGGGHCMPVRIGVRLDAALVHTTDALGPGETATVPLGYVGGGGHTLRFEATGQPEGCGPAITSWAATVDVTDGVCSCSGTCEAGGGGDEGGDGGGGRGWWLARPGGTGDTPESDRGLLSGLMFLDLDADAVRGEHERTGFADTVVIATVVAGETPGQRYRGVVDAQGRYTLDLPAGTYTLTWEPSAPLVGYLTTTPPVAAEVRAAMTTEVDIGWRDARLVRYAPCLTIAEISGTGGTAVDILGRLHTQDGVAVDAGMHRKGVLMTRREFLTLLHRTQCLQALGDTDALQSALLTLILSDPRVHMLQLIDEPLGGRLSEWADILYSALADGLRFGRETQNGLAADGDAPINRQEIMHAIQDIIALRRPAQASVAQSGPLTQEALLSSGMFPPRFGLAMHAGVTWEEGAGILARTAFANGRVDLAGPQVDWTNPLPSGLRWLSLPAPSLCLARNESRSRMVRVAGVSPATGDAYWSLRFLASLGAADADGRPRWLLVGNPESEFGVREGTLDYPLDRPVTLLELFRTLAVITCHPVETETQTADRRSGKPVIHEAATGHAVFAPDRIVGTMDDASFVSRLFHGVQRPIRRFNLSVPVYAPEALRRGGLRPDAPVTTEDAASLLVSALLYRRVNTGILAPLDADRRAPELKMELLRHLSPPPGGRRRGTTGTPGIVTRRQLLSVLAGVLVPEYSPAGAGQPSLAEAWWDWLR